MPARVVIPTRKVGSRRRAWPKPQSRQGSGPIIKPGFSAAGRPSFTRTCAVSSSSPTGHSCRSMARRP